MEDNVEFENDEHLESPHNDPNLNDALKGWIKENPWFNSDPVLREAAIEIDSKLHLQGVPPGKQRFNNVEDKLRSAYPERFYDVPDRKLMWSDIVDPVERRQAKLQFEKLQARDKDATHKIRMTQEQYLKDYLDR